MRPAARAAARDRAQRGSATPFVLAAAALVVALGAALALLGAGLAAGSRARTAADLAALAAAEAFTATPCVDAEAVATRNGARLVSCTPDGDGVTVVTETRVLSLPVRARARAVPGPLAAGVARSPPG